MRRGRITQLFLIVGYAMLYSQSEKDSIITVRKVSEMVKKQIAEAEKEWLKLWNEGPTKMVWDKIPVQEGDKATDFELESSSKQTIKLSDLWSEQPILLLFWRHTSCGCGFIRADSIRKSMML